MRNRLIKEFSKCNIIEYKLIDDKHIIIWFHFNSNTTGLFDACYYSQNEILNIHNDSLRKHMTDMRFEKKLELTEYMKNKYNITIIEVA